MSPKLIHYKYFSTSIIHAQYELSETVPEICLQNAVLLLYQATSFLGVLNDKPTRFYDPLVIATLQT